VVSDSLRRCSEAIAEIEEESSDAACRSTHRGKAMSVFLLLMIPFLSDPGGFG